MFLPRTFLVSTFLLHFSLTLFSTNAQELRPTRKDALYDDLISILKEQLDGTTRFGKRSMNRFQFIPVELIEEYHRNRRL